MAQYLISPRLDLLQHFPGPFSFLCSKVIERGTWRHFIYHSLSQCGKSIWIMRRSTCQAWLSWLMDYHPNTYTHLKGKSEKQRDWEYTHCTAGYLHVFLSTCLRAWIDNGQRGVVAQILHQSSVQQWEMASVRWNSLSFPQLIGFLGFKCHKHVAVVEEM